MPSLIDSLHNHDLGHLRIVADLWGISISSSESDAAVKELAAALLNPDLVKEIVETLPVETRPALTSLVDAGGKVPWTTFVRQAGDLRQVGPGQRDREKTHLHPVSNAEILYYRALLGRGFFDTPSGVQEYAYIPDDLLPLIPREGDESHGKGKVEPLLGRSAIPREHAEPLPSNDRILDDATTLLAALRMGNSPKSISLPPDVITDFLVAANILADGEPDLEAVRAFLEAPRGEALNNLKNAWMRSTAFNELRQVPALVCDGEWQNDPLATRQRILGFLKSIPRGRWWSLPAFIQDVKEKSPDIQRTAGEYDTWFIRRREDESTLRGFEKWDEVEGALIRYIITGPLWWLRMVDLAKPKDMETITAFRLSTINPWQIPAENARLHVSSQGRISIPKHFPRLARYQVARFCQWEEEKADEYQFQVTPSSLKKAGEQGLKATQLLSLLAKNSAVEIPPAFVRALKRWEKKGTEARLETRVILRVTSPEVLEELRKSKAGRFLGELLGPVTVSVKPGAQSRVLAAMAEMGILAEDESPGTSV